MVELVFHRAARDVQALGNLVVEEVLRRADEENFVAALQQMVLALVAAASVSRVSA